jgi:hypothetical protein
MNGIQTAEIFTQKLIMFATTLSKLSLIIGIKDCVELRFILRTADVMRTPTPHKQF